MIKYHGIDRLARVPARYQLLRVDRHPDYGEYFAAIQVASPGGILSLLQEEGGGPVLLTLLTQATESPKTWHSTGNPFPLKELWSAPVRLPHPTPSGPTWKLPLLDDLCNELGVTRREWGPSPTGGLTPAELVQNRWMDADPQDIIDRLEHRLDTDEPINLCARTPVPAFSSDPRYSRGPSIYLSTSDDLPDWVKLGKAESAQSAVTRMFAQQCCNPRRLRHLRVWRPNGPLREQLRRIERQSFGKALGTIANGVRSEWYRVNVREALRVLDNRARSIGFEIAYSS